ncbi:MAG: extracellular solute-binding protein [Pirellulales bacterium]
MHRLLLSIVTFPLLTGCLVKQEREVVVYTALDQEFSEPIFRRFTEETGIVVLAKYDTESTKTVGLANAILAERRRARCDLFWNNEILNTLRLQRQGLLDTYRSPVSAGYPAFARSPRDQWHGFAARARVLLVNTDQVSDGQRPRSILDLIDPAWRGRVGMAKPLFGTTATHAACLFAYWGEGRARQFFLDVKRNAKILAGNKRVALSVSNGEIAFGITDTDDAIIEVEKGMPVAIIYPDQGEDGMGTLLIPNTLALIRGGPHTRDARRLVDYLLSPEVEGLLAAGPSAQIPLGPDTGVAVRVATPDTIRVMQVDFQRAADHWERAAQFLRDTMTGGD